MLSKLSSRLRPPTAYEAFAIVLAFLALGSGSYAAISITGKNVKDSSLTGSDVKNSSLTGKDVKNNSLTGADVKNIKSGDVSDRSLLAKDFKAGQLPSGPPGTPGQRGPSDAYHPPEDVHNMTIPAGDYVVVADRGVDNTDATAGVLTCRIFAGPNIVDEGKQSYPASGSAMLTMTAPLHTAQTLNVAYGCETSTGATFTLGQLNAIKVGALHTTPGS